MKRKIWSKVLVFSLAIGLILVLGRSSYAQDEESQNLELANRFIEEILIGGDPANIADIFADPVRTHSPTSDEFADFPAAVWGQIVTGRIGSDETITVHQVAASGDVVFIHLTHEATFENQTITPRQNVVEPTGEPVTIRRVLVLRFEDGKVVEQWDYHMNPLWAVDYLDYLPAE